MGLVPQHGTPLARTPAPGTFDELLVIAAMRLRMPERLIPASLDVAGLAGLDARLHAGANVVTSIVPPTAGLAGVSQSELDIDQGLRTVAEAGHLAALGLRTRPTMSTAPGWPAPASGWRSGARGGSEAGAMRLAVIGGKLQGTEAVYLAGKAGYETVLIDRRPAPPAAGPRRRAARLRRHRRRGATRTVLRTCDAVLPACENDVTLAWLAEKCPPGAFRSCSISRRIA